MHLPPWIALTSPQAETQQPSAPAGSQAPGAPQAPPSGAPSGDGGTTSAPAPSAPPPGGDLWGTLILFGGMFLLLWLFLLGPERRKRKQHEQRLAQLREKDEVMTLGGIFGTVVLLRGEQVTLRVDEKRGTTLRVARSSIATILPRESAAAGTAKEKDEGNDEA